MGLRGVILGLRGLTWGLRGLIWGLRGLIWGLRGSSGGGTYGRTDGRMDGRTDVWKFTPVSYRTSALWGRCPKSTPALRDFCIPSSTSQQPTGRLYASCRYRESSLACGLRILYAQIRLGRYCLVRWTKYFNHKITIF